MHFSATYSPSPHAELRVRKGWRVRCSLPTDLPNNDPRFHTEKQLFTWLFIELKLRRYPANVIWQKLVQLAATDVAPFYPVLKETWEAGTYGPADPNNGFIPNGKLAPHVFVAAQRWIKEVAMEYTKVRMRMA